MILRLGSLDRVRDGLGSMVQLTQIVLLLVEWGKIDEEANSSWMTMKTHSRRNAEIWGPTGLILPKAWRPACFRFWPLLTVVRHT